MRIIISAQNEKKLIDSNKGFDNILNEASLLSNGNFYLTHNDTVINKDTDLLNIQDLSVLNLVEVEVGGGKGGKRKKKQFKTPKIIKRRHRNKKLSVLDYYAVEKDGSIKRVRKLCINKSCSEQGIFMGDMWNRHYCGKCHTNLVKKNAPKEEPKKKKEVVKQVEEVEEDKGKGKGKKGKKGK